MANEAGQGCADRSSNIGGYTFVSEGAPASQGGNVVKLGCFCGAAAQESGTFAFFTAVGNDLTAKAGTQVDFTVPAAADACVEIEAPGDFTAFSVDAGNYLGCYVTNANSCEQDYSSSGGAGVWYISGDQTEGVGVTFSIWANGIDGLNADIEAGGVTTYEKEGFVIMHLYRMMEGYQE